MKSTFEEMGGTYRQEGDYLLPNIEPPESPQIGTWGQRRLHYLRTSKSILYTTMLLSGTLKDHLEETDQSVNEMATLLTAQMKEHEGVTEKLKTVNQMEWVQRMNNIRSRVQEIILKELIYI